MRQVPQMPNMAKSVIMTSSFYGYNHNKIISDGEMFDMQNMSGDSFPLLTQRKQRGIASYDVEGQDPVPLTGIHGRDQLVFIRGTKVFYNFIEVSGISVSTSASMLPKQIVSMGAYVCIFPDKVYFNTVDSTDKGSMERLYSTDSGNISLIMCRNDGTNYDYTSIARGTEAPANPENGALWLDESGSKAILKQYMASAEEWLEVMTTYIKIQATGIGAGLKEYDVIDIDGLTLGGENPDPVIADQVNTLNTSMIVYAAGNDYIIVAGILSAAVEEEGLEEATVTANLTVPDMDWIVESNNRLWGCKYGMKNGEVVNEIYASALGSFKVWERFMGNSTDSWTAQVGSDGPFTGAITQRGYPVFSKEGCFHRISGTTPQTFQIQTTYCRGVQRGSGRSMAIVAENIYYKARDGIMVYDGNMPVQVSAQLGEELYSDARAGVLRDKYYISMKDKNNNFVLMVYDTKNNIWWKEDGAKALGFGAVADELFYIDENNNTLVSVNGSVGDEEGALDWRADFDLYGVHYRQENGYDDPRRIRNKKYVSLFKIRLELGANASVKLYMQYDGGDWELKGEKTGDRLRTVELPVVPKRCDNVRFRLEGHGDCAIYDISRVMEVGGNG